MRFLTQTIGVGLIIVALVDIYLTVLFPRLGSSILSLRLTKGMWRLFWLVAHLIPSKDKKLLSHSGPILIVATITVWICLLVCGFALIVWTSLGASIRSTRGMTETDFITALYYSGFSLTTLGTGDFTPETNTRFWQPYYALPRILLLSMDTATLIKSALHSEKYPLIHSTAVAELWGGGLQLLVELSSIILPKSRSNNNDMLEQVWRKRYYHAVEKFTAEGIETVTDLEAGASNYISLRRKWNPSLARLAKYMAYNWSEIAQK